MKALLPYLLEVSICHTGFYLLYRLVLSRLTFFHLSRFYLLVFLVLSFVIPLLSIGVYEINSADNSIVNLIIIGKANLNPEPSIDSVTSFDWYTLLMNALLIIYVIGVAFYTFRLVKGLVQIARTIKQNPIAEFNGYILIETKSGPAFYSFLKYIFINKNRKLEDDERQYALRHEVLHLRLGHSIDTLLMEFARILCWFNPVMIWYRKSMIENHEYEVDSLIVQNPDQNENYINLILKLSMNKNEPGLVSQFSMNSIKNRINMLYQSKSKKMKKLYFLSVLPLLALFVSIFSCTERAQDNELQNGNVPDKPIIENISWEGNTLYSDEYLSNAMNISTGDVFDETTIDQNLSYKPDGGDLSALYMDQGYLYFSVDYRKEMVGDNKLNLIFTIHEGEKAHLKEINVKGLQKHKRSEIDHMLQIKSGELFNRSKLVKTQKALAESGLFDAEKVMVEVVPDQVNQTVDIAFTVKEK